MGADAWDQRGPYDPDFGAALRAAQEIELRSGSYNFGVQTIEELWRDDDWLGFVGDEGTGTVLDLNRLIAADEPDAFGTLRPMPAGEFRELLGIFRRPAFADFVDGYADGKLPMPAARGSARCAVLYRDEKPSEIVYWGLTAD